MPLRMLAAICLLALPALGQISPQTVSPVGRPASQAVTVQTAGTAPLAVTGSLSVSGAADTVGNSATFSSNSVCATVLLAGQQSVGFNLAAGTLAATLTPALSQDATPATPGCTGGTWTATAFVDTSGNTSATLVVTNPSSAYFAGLKTLGGARCARVCTTSYSSGSAAGYLVATTVPSPPPAAGADVTDRAGRLLGQLTDGSSAITPAKTGQLPTALDGSGYLKVHEQGTATVTGTVTANAGTGTMAVSATSLPLPTGAATSAKQPALGTAGASSTDVLSVQGIASGTALPVSAASLPLPTGASTAAKQPALGTAGTASSDVITVQGITSMTPLKVDNSGVTQPVSGTVAATQSGTWTVQPGNTANTTAWKVDGSAVTQPVSGTVNAAQSGTWNVTNVSGTVSLPTGAATSAKQPALGTAGTPSTDVITVQGATSMTALKVDGSGVTQPVSGTVTANAGTGTMATSNAALALAQGSTTSGQTGPLLQGAVTAAAPTYTTAQTDPLSLTTAGGLRADLLSVNGTTILTGNGTAGAGAQRVTIASDNTAFSVNATLQTGSNTIGAVTAPGAAALALDASVTGLQVAQGSTTSGQKGSLLLGAVTTGSPSYTTAQSSPLSLDTAGNLRVNVVAGGGAGGTSSSFGSAVPATGTAAGFSDGTNMQLGRVFDADSGAGTQYVEGVNLRKIASGGSVEAGTSSDPLRIDPTGTTTQPVSGTVTANAGTGNFTVAQATGTNLHAVIDSGSTTAVTQATASNLNAQVQGAAASGASKAGNPVQVGGVFNTTQPTVTTGQAVEAQATARGALIVAKGVDGFALDANQSVNVAQLAGTATDTNSGNKSAGTLRVVLATDQPALTNKLLVTPDANSAVNVAQVNGVATSVGNGVSGTGVQRVTIASDSTGQVALAAGSALIGKAGIDQTTPGTTNAVAVSTLGSNAVATGNGTSSSGTLRVAVASDNTAFSVKPTDGTNTITVKAASTGSATTDTAQVVTLSPNPSPQCTSWVAINQTTSTRLVTGTASQKLYICAIMIVSATAQSVSLVEGTGTVCATGIAGLMGNTTASIALIDNGGFSLAAGLPFGKSKTAADDLCLLQSGAGNISGFISYVSAP